jgi:hypothetical protein
MLPGVRIGSLSQVDRSRTGTVAAWVMDGEQRLERQVASAAFYNEKAIVNDDPGSVMRCECGNIATIFHRFLRESGELDGYIDAIAVVEMGNSTINNRRG